MIDKQLIMNYINFKFIPKMKMIFPFWENTLEVVFAPSGLIIGYVYLLHEAVPHAKSWHPFRAVSFLKKSEEKP